MKRLLYIPLFLLLAPLCHAPSAQMLEAIVGAQKKASGATITHVGSSVCAPSYVSATSVATSYTSAGAGNTIVVGVGNEDGGTPATTSVTDNKSQTYAHSAGPVSADITLDMFTKVSTASGVTSITTNFASAPNAYIEVCVSEYSGPVSIGNVTTSITGFTTTTYTLSNSLTYGGDFNVLFVISSDSAAQTPTATAGTVRQSDPYAYHNSWIQDNTSASAGSLAVSGTVGTNASGGPHTMGIVELKNQ